MINDGDENKENIRQNKEMSKARHRFFITHERFLIYIEKKRLKNSRIITKTQELKCKEKECHNYGRCSRRQ